MDDPWKSFDHIRRMLEYSNPLKELIERQKLISRTLEPAIRANDLQLHALGLQQEDISAAVQRIQLDIQPAIEQFHDAATRYRALGLSLEDQLASSSSLISALRRVSEDTQDILTPLRNSFPQLAVTANFQALDYIGDYFNSIVVDTTGFDIFRRSAGYAYLDYINQLEAAAEDEARIAEIFDEFFEFLYSLWEKLPKTIISWQFIRDLLKDFLILYLIINPMNEQMEERINENTTREVRASEERERNHFDARLQEFEERCFILLDDDFVEDSVYIVTEKTYVIKSKDGKEPIAILQPNMAVIVLDKEDEEWWLVNYSDYVNAVQGEGWVQKQYLQEIE